MSDGGRTRDDRNHNPVLCQLNYTHHTEICDCKKMVHPTGFEPVTYGLEIRCSIQLSYGCTLCSIAVYMISASTLQYLFEALIYAFYLLSCVVYRAHIHFHKFCLEWLWFSPKTDTHSLVQGQFIKVNVPLNNSLF